MPMLCASNYLLAYIERHFQVPRLGIDLSKNELYYHLNFLLMMDGKSGIIDGKYYRSLEIFSRSLLH